MDRFYHMSVSGGGKLVIRAESADQAIQKAKAAGYHYTGTSVYTVSDWYREQFRGWYTEVQ